MKDKIKQQQKIDELEVMVKQLITKSDKKIVGKNLNINSLLRILKVLKVGIEPTLPKKLDFESSASTNSAT